MIDDELADGKLMSLRGRCQKHGGGQYENGTKHESSLHGWTFACGHTPKRGSHGTDESFRMEPDVRRAGELARIARGRGEIPTSAKTALAGGAPGARDQRSASTGRTALRTAA